MPVAWAAAIAAVGSVVSGSMQSSAAKDAASTQAAAADRASQVSQNEFNTITQQESPYMQSGYGAQSQLNYLLGITPQNPQASAASNNPYYNGSAPNGYDPSSGWGAGAGGNMHQFLTQGNGGNGVAAPGMQASQTYGPGKGSPSVPNYQNPYAQYSGAGSNQTPQATGSTGQPYGAGQPGVGLQPTTSSVAGGYGSLLSPFTIDQFHKMSPAYQFQMQQGQQGVLNGDASGAGALSGAAQKDLMGYNQNMANTSFNDAFNQYQTQQGNIYNRLASVAQLGQNAAANTGAQGTSLAGQTAQSISNAGSARAAGQIGAANAWSGAIQSATPWLMSYGGNASSGASDAWSGAAAGGSYAQG